MNARRLMTIAAPLVGALLLAATTQAATVKCQRAIAKAGAAFVQAKMKALKKCEESVVKGAIPGPCPDGKATDSTAKATTKLSTSIGKSCGGADKLCGGDLTGEDSPASLGWPAQCPNFEHGICNGDLDDCDDIAACITCADGSAADQAAALYYDALVPHGGDSTIRSCQTAIGKAGAAFLAAKS